MKRSILAYSLLLNLALPAARAWQHLLNGHYAVQCPVGAPNHIHQSACCCDLYSVYFSTPLQTPVPESGAAPALFCDPVVHGDISAPVGEAWHLFGLRAPPV